MAHFYDNCKWYRSKESKKEKKTFIEMKGLFIL